jgi:CelD/BcsL family acetyltransferase involved in cellulose biosynthesis
VLGAWDEMIIPRMDGEAVFSKLLIEALAGAGFSTECIVTETAPYIPLPATWEGYLKALPSSRRYFLKRSLRDFDKWAAGQATYHRAASHQELEEGKSVLVALHNGRWSSDGRVGKFHSPRFQAFHEMVMPALFDQGALELIWVAVRGKPVAALYNIVWNNKVYFYQSGRTTNLPDNIRPGVVIQAHAIRAAIAAGRREYDFLGGASQYKLQLAPASRRLVQVRVISCRYKERARRYCDHLVSLGRSVRNIVRARCASWRKRGTETRYESRAVPGSNRSCGAV